MKRYRTPMAFKTALKQRLRECWPSRVARCASVPKYRHHGVESAIF